MWPDQVSNPGPLTCESGDLLEMCMWVFDGARMSFHRLTDFLSCFCSFFCFVGYGLVQTTPLTIFNGLF